MLSVLLVTWSILTIGLFTDVNAMFTPTEITTIENHYKTQVCGDNLGAYMLVPNSQCKKFYQCQRLGDLSFNLIAQSCARGTLFKLVVPIGTAQVPVCDHAESVDCAEQENTLRDEILGNTVKPPRDCSEVTSVPGVEVYEISPNADMKVKVRCDFNTSNGPWTVIQSQRTFKSADGPNFERTWKEYEKGFANGPYEHLDYWIGLEKLYVLTNSDKFRLRVDMVDEKAGIRFAEYNRFSVDDSSTDYKLDVGRYRKESNAGDMLKYHHGAKFSTKDHGERMECSNSYGGGGWWFQKCLTANPNGQLGAIGYSNMAVWNAMSTLRRSLKRIEMKIARVPPA